MKLRELEGQFVKITIPNREHRYVDTIAEADGVQFQCPKCWTTNGGPIGTHYVLCWRPRVPQSEPPTPGRWEMQGTGLDDLTLVAGSSSVAIVGGCAAHFFVRNGAIEMV